MDSIKMKGKFVRNGTSQMTEAGVRNADEACWLKSVQIWSENASGRLIVLGTCEVSVLNYSCYCVSQFNMQEKGADCIKGSFIFSFPEQAHDLSFCRLEYGVLIQPLKSNQ